MCTSTISPPTSRLAALFHVAALAVSLGSVASAGDALDGSTLLQVRVNSGTTSLVASLLESNHTSHMKAPISPHSPLVPPSRPWDSPWTRKNATAIPPQDLELVVASHCEDADWLLEFQGSVSLYNKGGDSCLPALQGALQKRNATLGENGRRDQIKNLPNLGREGMTYLRHIIDHYDNLAPYTAFSQGKGEHNGVYVMEKVDEFLSLGIRDYPFYPILHRNDKGLLLYRDKDPDEKVVVNKDNIEERPEGYDVAVFNYDNVPGLSIPDKARAIYMALYGGTACEAPPMLFAAGAQFIVSREAIQSKGKEFWEHIANSLEGARCAELGYVLERAWSFLFDPAIKPLAMLGEFPDYCEWHTGRLKKNRGDCEEFRKDYPGFTNAMLMLEPEPGPDYPNTLFADAAFQISSGNNQAAYDRVMKRKPNLRKDEYLKIFAELETQGVRRDHPTIIANYL